MWNAGSFRDQAHLAEGQGSLVKRMLFQHGSFQQLEFPLAVLLS